MGGEGEGETACFEDLITSLALIAVATSTAGLRGPAAVFMAPQSYVKPHGSVPRVNTAVVGNFPLFFFFFFLGGGGGSE